MKVFVFHIIALGVLYIKSLYQCFTNITTILDLYVHPAFLNNQKLHCVNTMAHFCSFTKLFIIFFADCCFFFYSAHQSLTNKTDCCVTTALL